MENFKKIMSNKIIILSIILFLLSGLAAGYISAAAGNFETAVRVKKNGSIYEAGACGFFRADPLKVWALITDHEKAPIYLNSIKHSRILKRTGNRVVIEQTIRIPLNELNMVLEMTEDPKQMVLIWKQLKGPFKINSGKWILSQHGKGVTKGIYTIRLEDDSVLPDWIVSYMINSSIPEMFKAISRQVE